MASITLSELLGAQVADESGKVRGRVKEVAISPGPHAAVVSAFVVKTSGGQCLIPSEAVIGIYGRLLRTSGNAVDWPPFVNSEGLLLLEHDLLDQQIIDVHGRKVVRVNDVDLQEDRSNNHVVLKVAEVDVGARGAVRRLLKGVVPWKPLNALLEKIPPRVIPWNFVDLIETDPARRVKLKIAHERLAKLHPADIADIVEELAPAEREAVFETLDEEVAAEALEEVEPKVQAAIVESLDSERAADIVEEMDPDAAADLLADLPKETTREILEEMRPEEREEVAELLEFHENTAAGKMTTDYLALPPTATVQDAIDALRNFEGGIETISMIFLVDKHDVLLGWVPLRNLVLNPPATKLSDIIAEPLVTVHVGAKEREVAELFDKYNLLTLPVVDDHAKLTGVVTADDVISLLRAKL
ncbi:MAG: magnesium transporter [Acidobacteria bacterium]|nr:magnesium transporter [Acidobacteriota bacterium]